MYGSQQAQQFKDLNLPYPRKDSDPQDTNLYNHQNQQQQQQMSSGLLRYRSAPSTLLGEFCEDFLPVRPLSSPETERIFDRFLASDLEKSSMVTVGSNNQHMVSGSGGLSAGENIMYQTSNQHMVSSNLLENSFRAVGSMGMDEEEIKNGSNNNCHSSLIRQSSSPAGLFAQLNPENGFGMMRGISGFRNVSSPSGDSANRLKGQLSFSLSRQNSIMSQISEVASEGMDGSSPEDSGGVNRSFISGFPIGSWDESSLLSENKFSGLKQGGDGLAKNIAGLNSSEHQNGEMRNHVSGLAHQFSLPKTSSEMAAIEKFLQDAVPCKIRAKRGCATHPRSIAERVRRTRISERMRKLQELVPNMDKQTNTADMLDLAVGYIKDLQKQVKTLSDSRASCTCSASMQRTFPNSAV